MLGWVARVRVGVILLLKFEVSRFRRGVFGLRCGASSICSQVEPAENARYTPDKIEIEIRSHLARHRQLPFSVRTALTVINCPRLQSLTFNVNKQMTPTLFSYSFPILIPCPDILNTRKPKVSNRDILMVLQNTVRVAHTIEASFRAPKLEIRSSSTTRYINKGGSEPSPRYILGYSYCMWYPL